MFLSFNELAELAGGGPVAVAVAVAFILHTN